MFRMCTYIHKIILIKEYFNNNFYFIFYIYRSGYTFWCYGKRPSLVRVRVRSIFRCYGKRPNLVCVRAIWITIWITIWI